MKRSEIKLYSEYLMLPHTDYMSEEQAAKVTPAKVYIMNIRSGYCKAGFDLLVKFTSVDEFVKYFGKTPAEMGYEITEDFVNPLVIEADSEFITELPSEDDLVTPDFSGTVDSWLQIGERLKMHIYRKDQHLAVSIWALDENGKATTGKPISQHTYDLEYLDFRALLEQIKA